MSRGGKEDIAPAMTRGRCIWLAILALCLAQALAAQCSNDSCLSVLRNAPTSKNATADCLSFIKQVAPTGTPRSTTTTVTSTKRVATLTLHRSARVTGQTTKPSLTTSEAEENGNHKRAEVENHGVTGERPSYLPEALQERWVTTSPVSSILPVYAAECSSISAYLSACSCLGLSMMARAAAQLATTKTVTAIRTVANVTLPPFFANSTRSAGYNGTGTGTGTVASTIYMGRTTSRNSPLRPTTLFTSRMTSSKGASSGSGLISVSNTATFFGSQSTSKGTSSGSKLGSISRTTTSSGSKETSKTTSSGLASTSISGSSKPSTTKSTVDVVTIATLTTTKVPLWVNMTSTRSYPAGNITEAPYTNSTAALPTVSANITSSVWLNATTSVKYPIPINSTASWYNVTLRSSTLAETGTGVIKTTASIKFPIPYNTTASWYNETSTSLLPLGTGTGVILTTGTGPIRTTTSARVPYPMNTTASWSNGTSTAFLPLGTGTGTGVILTTGKGVILTTAPATFPTSTSVRYPFPVNNTAFWSNGTATTASPVRGTGTGYYNTSIPTSTTTSSASPTANEDLTCGETTIPFSLRVSQPGGTFDKWFVHVVGNGLLFTSSQERASSFSVEGTGHLCEMGYKDGSGKPRIAAVGVAGPTDGAGDGSDREAVEGEGPVMMLRQGTLKAYKEDYKALECTKDGRLSCKPANGTSTGADGGGGGGGGGWIGCGVQLSMGRDIDLGYGGLNCTAVSLEVVEP